MFARRRGPRNRRIAIGGVALVGLLVVYLLFFRGGGEDVAASGGDFTTPPFSASSENSGQSDDRGNAGYLAGTGGTGSPRHADFGPAGAIVPPDNGTRGTTSSSDRNRRGQNATPTTIAEPPRTLEMGQALPGPGSGAAGSPTRDSTRPATPTTTQPSSTTPSSPAPSAKNPPSTGVDEDRASRTAARRPADSSTSTASASTEVSRLIGQAEQFERQNRLIDSRATYNVALHHPQAGDVANLIRERMGRLNDVLMFSPTVVEGDPFTETYVIQKGDMLAKIAPRYAIDWRFICRINNISRPERVRVGQKIKLVRGPFHAVIDKSRYTLDLYIGDPDAYGRRMFVKTFTVGLGEYNSTPTGAFIVRQSSKLVNPPWTNPRTGEHFDADDPMNPIGERWIGLEGVDSATETLAGYGIHGTIDPDSIGKQRSMGCVRLRPDDVNLMYEVLMEAKSSVYIQD